MSMRTFLHRLFYYFYYFHLFSASSTNFMMGVLNQNVLECSLFRGILLFVKLSICCSTGICPASPSMTWTGVPLKQCITLRMYASCCTWILFNWIFDAFPFNEAPYFNLLRIKVFPIFTRVFGMAPARAPVDLRNNIFIELFLLLAFSVIVYISCATILCRARNPCKGMCLSALFFPHELIFSTCRSFFLAKETTRICGCLHSGSVLPVCLFLLAEIGSRVPSHLCK